MAQRDAWQCGLWGCVADVVGGRKGCVFHAYCGYGVVVFLYLSFVCFVCVIPSFVVFCLVLVFGVTRWGPGTDTCRCIWYGLVCVDVSSVQEKYA